jgi:WD40 repeat protein
VVTFEQINVLQVEDGDVGALDFSADDQRLFTGSDDGKHLKPRSNEDEN